MHKLLEIRPEENSMGLIQYLKGEADWKDAVRFVESLRIFVMISGGATSRSAEYLSSDRMETLIQALKKEFDYIIIIRKYCDVLNYQEMNNFFVNLMKEAK